MRQAFAGGLQEHIPVCPCGGKEFPNDCERKKAKQQLDYADACKK